MKWKSVVSANCPARQLDNRVGERSQAKLLSVIVSLQSPVQAGEGHRPASDRASVLVAEDDVERRYTATAVSNGLPCSQASRLSMLSIIMRVCRVALPRCGVRTTFGSPRSSGASGAHR